MNKIEWLLVLMDPLWKVMSIMHIIVLVKQVPDPDGPPKALVINKEAKTVTPEGIPPVLSPYDENALEAALRIKDAHGARVTVMSLGKKISRRVLLRALAAGADDLVMLQGPAFGSESYETAHVLAAGIQKLGVFDLILCGRQAADTDAGLVGIFVAELLGIPSVSCARKLDLVSRAIRLERSTVDGYEVLELPVPGLVTVSSDLYVLRYPTFPEIRAAQKKPVTIWNSDDIGINLQAVHQTQLLHLFARVSETTCEFLPGDTPEAVGINLADKLMQIGAIRKMEFL